MDVDTGIRSRRAENYIPTLPQLNFASMNTGHAEIRVWSAYKEELTSWLCLLDDRTFQKEHHHGYLNAFGAGKGDKGDKGKGEKGKKGKGDKGKAKGDKGKGKGERADKANKGNEKDKSGKGSSARAKSKAKKTDVCHHCGKKGHWARDCWLRQAAAVSSYEANATVTTGTAGSSGGTTAGSASAATKAAPKLPGSQPTTKGDVGKGAEKGVRTFFEGAYFAMPMVAPSFIESGDKIFWLLDSGSSSVVLR
eukprot:s14035_g1.t1